MRLKKLFFANRSTGWHVDIADFGKLTLLVGASGVGKTQILKSIRTLAQIAQGGSFEGVEWRVVFCEEGKDYEWSGQFESVPDHEIVPFDHNRYTIKHETLIDNDGKEIFTRSGDGITYNGVPTVKLDSTKSAVELLKEEPDVAPASNAFKKVTALYMERSTTIRISALRLYSTQDSKLSLKDIKNINAFSPIESLYLIQKNDKEAFEDIKESFTDIFPLVEDIDFEMKSFGRDDLLPILKIKEKDVDNWIFFPDISSGMCRTLSQIVTLRLADDGDVILIDEFENGLGINCIDSLADMAKDPDADVQIIMTSHHPYIINSIPVVDWLVVSRKGSEVKAVPATELRIGANSHHDAFMQLIQTSAYRTGQS